MPRPGRTCQYAGGLSLRRRQAVIVHAIDAQRALAHHMVDRVQLTRAIGASPRAQATTDAQGSIDQDDAVRVALVRGPGWAHGHAGGLGAVQAGARKMHGPGTLALAGLEAVDPVQPRT